MALVDDSCNVGGLLLGGVWVEGDDELRGCGVGEELGFEFGGLAVCADFGQNRTDPGLSTPPIHRVRFGFPVCNL